MYYFVPGKCYGSYNVGKQPICILPELPPKSNRFLPDCPLKTRQWVGCLNRKACLGEAVLVI